MTDPGSIAVVADDFTSAMDAAGPFARVGHAACVLRGGGTTEPSASVWAIDCDSRRRARQEAERRTSEAIARVRHAGTLVKTVDSTLRGHVGPEIAAAWRTAGRRLTLVAPAFPAAGRTTRGGRQYVDGVAVDESGFARDGRHPARTSDLRVLLQAAGVPDVAVRGTGEALPDAGVVVVDAEHDADLRAAVSRAGDRTGLLWVGSPGLARALAEHRPGAALPRDAGEPARRVVVVAGTRHEATRRQVGTLLARLGDRAVVVGDAGSRLSSRVDAAILLAPPYPGSRPVDAPTALAVADGLARRAAGLIRRGGFDGCIATGGETADALVRALGGETIEVLGEPEPGVGLGVVRGRSRCLLATKAGAFGDAGLLVRLHQEMTANERVPGD